MSRFRALAAVLVALVVGLGLTPGPSAATAANPVAPVPGAAGDGSRLTVALMPDTQFYARYADPIVGDKYTPRWGVDPWQAQSEWLVANQARYNIAFTTHLGDLVDQSNKPGQWQVADRSMKILEDGGMPYSVLMGNHDVGGAQLDGQPVDFDTTFPVQRAKQDPTFVAASPSGHARFHTFTAQGQQFGVVALGWLGYDDFDWVKGVLAAHPTLPTIFTTHQILNVADDGVTPLDTEFGNDVFDQLVSPFDQVFLTVNGHHHGALQRVKDNAAGHPVVQVLMDYQMDYAGGNGDMGLVELDLTNGVISGTAFSPWVLRKPADTIVEYDQALLAAPGSQYSIPFDFQSRFPGLDASHADRPSLTTALRADIAAQFTNPTPTAEVPAKDMADYRVAEGTVAHWRIDPARMAAEPVADGAPVPIGGRLVDVAGAKDMTRQPVDALLTTGELGDVTLSSDHHPLSSDPWSVCFANATRDGNRTSFFATAMGGRINEERFEDGYTFESFIKVDPSFTPDANRWMVAVGRAGDRGVIAPTEMIEGGEPPMALALSNLQEVQWSFMAAQRPTNDWGDGSAWSGDIDTDKWFHVAVTNDPATKVTTMFLNGVPMLRSVDGLVGLERQLDGVWTIGGDVVPDLKADHGWNGCVGETRMVDHVIDRGMWLTQRAPSESTVTATATATTTATATATATTSATATETVAATRTATATATVEQTVVAGAGQAGRTGGH